MNAVGELLENHGYHSSYLSKSLGSGLRIAQLVSTGVSARRFEAQFVADIFGLFVNIVY